MASTSNPDPPPPPPSGDESSEGELRNWLELPPDVTAMILHKLGAIDILYNAQNVCTAWRDICKDPAMWRVIDMRNLWDIWDMPHRLETVTKHAVYRSCGQLVDLNIEYFGGDDLLEYISNRSSKLNRLRLVCCYENFSSEAFMEAFEKLPLLEELHLYYTYLSKEAIEAVGRCCPLLKSFKLNQQGHRGLHTEHSDDDALAIAKNMPQLRNLDLFGNQLTNEGLQAILDNCLHLESLDLRQCFSVNLAGEFGKMCSQRIKDLKHPYDSTEGYGFDTDVYDGESEDEPYQYGCSDIDYTDDVWSEDEYDNFCLFSDYEELFDD